MLLSFSSCCLLWCITFVLIIWKLGLICLLRVYKRCRRYYHHHSPRGWIIWSWQWRKVLGWEGKLTWGRPLFHDHDHRHHPQQQLPSWQWSKNQPCHCHHYHITSMLIPNWSWARNRQWMRLTTDFDGGGKNWPFSKIPKSIIQHPNPIQDTIPPQESQPPIPRAVSPRFFPGYVFVYQYHLYYRLYITVEWLRFDPFIDTVVIMIMTNIEIKIKHPPLPYPLNPLPEPQIASQKDILSHYSTFSISLSPGMVISGNTPSQYWARDDHINNILLSPSSSTSPSPSPIPHSFKTNILYPLITVLSIHTNIITSW